VIATASKRYFRIVTRQVDGEGLMTFCDKTSTHIEKTESASQTIQTNGLSVKENTNALECTAQNNSIFTFAFDSITSPPSFWDLWMNISNLLNI